MELERIPIVEEIPTPDGRHPAAAKPLTAFQSITAVCNDCGHTLSMDRDRLEELSAVPSFGYLWQHAYCRVCREAGVVKANVRLHGELKDIAPEDRLPVFDSKPPRPRADDRSDPYPTLPRSRLMRCA